MAIETAQRPPAGLTLDDVFVVDVDVHAHEIPQELAPFTDLPWRQAVENAARIPHQLLYRLQAGGEHRRKNRRAAA